MIIEKIMRGKFCFIYGLFNDAVRDISHPANIGDIAHLAICSIFTKECLTISGNVK
jgi:hypothetical protein